MTLRMLTPQTRVLWESLAVRTHQAKALRRVQALLWLDAGESLPAVAQRVYVTRQTVSHGVKHCHARHALPLRERRADGIRSGRPRRGQARVDPPLRAVLDHDPRAVGSRATVWTAPVLTPYLRDAHALRVARQRGRLALARVDVRWKRPRSRRAHRSATWRQSTGGARGDGTRARGPSASCSTRPSAPRCPPSPPALGAGGRTWRCLSPARMPGACGMGCCISGVALAWCWSRSPGTRRRLTPASP